MNRTSSLGSELVLAGITIAGITGIYLFVIAFSGTPASSGLIGHSIGIFGFMLMIFTETLYSIRKRSRRRPIGKMSEWLKFHIYTGIVGPYMVLLHSAWDFNGLAGITLLLTAVIVLSGFFGRYIYTAVPRTAQGAIIEREELEHQLVLAEEQLNERLKQRGLTGTWPESGRRTGGTLPLLMRGFDDLIDAIQKRLTLRKMPAKERATAAELFALERRRRQLNQQIDSLAAARSLLSLWHALHVPLGMTLFLFAFIHVGAALYYATLLK
jgi:hypothetical protein